VVVRKNKESIHKTFDQKPLLSQFFHGQKVPRSFMARNIGFSPTPPENTIVGKSLKISFHTGCYFPY
jgi:hypothetical protein